MLLGYSTRGAKPPIDLGLVSIFSGIAVFIAAFWVGIGFLVQLVVG